MADRTRHPEPFMDPARLGAQLRAKRRSLGLSVREAAEAAGVSAPTFSRVERGVNLPERDNLLRLARWADVRIDAVVQREGPSGSSDIHEPSASTMEAVELHLRADRNLRQEDADALSEMFRLAYSALTSRGSPRRDRRKKPT